MKIKLTKKQEQELIKLSNLKKVKIGKLVSNAINQFLILEKEIKKFWQEIILQ